jgi:glutaredoxin
VTRTPDDARKYPVVKPKPIRLFIKPYCGWCHKAIRWLDDHDVEYETIDVIANDEAFEEMLKLSGQELAPVIDVNGEILADFGPEELERFWKRIRPAK